MTMSPSEVESPVIELDGIGTGKKNKIIIRNDDHNTFEWVIASLMEIVDHSPEQAEQCAMIIHTRGKCDVKSGEFEVLRPMCEELINRGLDATIN